MDLSSAPLLENGEGGKIANSHMAFPFLAQWLQVLRGSTKFSNLSKNFNGLVLLLCCPKVKIIHFQLLLYPTFHCFVITAGTLSGRFTPVAQRRENPRRRGGVWQEELLHEGSLELELPLRRATLSRAIEERPGWAEVGYSELHLPAGWPQNCKQTYSLCFGKSVLQSLCSLQA